MALIKCPECGKEESDKASRCPQCGYPIHENINIDANSHVVLPVNDYSEQQKEITKRKFKPLIKVMIILFSLVIIATAVVCTIGYYNNNKTVTVSSIDISKWRLTDHNKYSDSYEGTVVSETKEPFVAVIGYYEDVLDFPKFVYVEDGKGIIQLTEGSDDDPSIKYNPIGYISGKRIEEKDFKNIVVSDSDYYDYDGLEESSCNINVKFEMASKKSGVLFFEMTNDATNEKKLNCHTVVSNGISEFTFYLSDLPYKTRGVDAKITPKFFCEADALTDADYEIEKSFNIEKGEYSSFVSYSGTEELGFQGYDDGAVLYTTELIDGGKKEDRGKIDYQSSHLKNGACNIGTYYSASNEDKILEPKYEINVVGYVPWKKFVKEI